jgi:hypothetical protein
MEEGYRAARCVTGRLSPEQMADLFVRLKGAMDGDFYVIDADERRIVLGNRRCPFGDDVCPPAARSVSHDVERVRRHRRPEHGGIRGRPGGADRTRRS